MLDDDVVHRNSELVREHLCIGGLVALALRLGAHRRDDLAGQVDTDVGRLPHRGAPTLTDGPDPLRRSHPADLDVGRQAHPEELAAALRLGLGLGQVVVAGSDERLVEGGLVVAGVDVDLRPAGRRAEAGRVLVRELVGRDEVLAADRRLVHADLGGEQVHRPLDDVRRLRATRAAVGIDEGGVRVDAHDLGVDVRDLVAAR